MSFAALDDALHGGVRDGVFPGAVMLVSRDGEVLFERAVGERMREPERAPMHPDVVFDLASLTKPLATTLAFLQLVALGRVQLDDRLTRFFPSYAVHGKRETTFRHLLVHSSGLVAHRPFWKTAAALGRPNFIPSREARAWVWDQIEREVPEAAPGTHAIYSDLGFIVLGQAVETLSGMPLDRWCRRRLFGPLGLDSIGFIDLVKVIAQRIQPEGGMIAATQRCPWRRRILCGEVDDENAWLMGGIAGHAGLFGTARDVDGLATILARAGRGQEGPLPPALVRQMWTIDPEIPGSTRTPGWDTPSRKASSAGTQLAGRRLVGHLGFTGTSLWIDLDQRINVVLLTNRGHPRRDNDRIRALRPVLHDLVWDALK